MKFTKMHGSGNDFIVVDARRKKISAPSRLARLMCERRYGIGADGLILVLPPQRPSADFRMRIFNTDGSEAEMCGNGIRCLGKFVYEHRLTRKKRLIIQTKAGNKGLRLFVSRGTVQKVLLNLGYPVPVKNQRITTAFKGLRMTCISLGNPHCVVFVNKDLASFPVEKLGPRIERHPGFPNRTNVEFVRILNRNCIQQRTWERGIGETLACGTGAGAAVSAGIMRGKLNSRVKVRLKGGTLFIEWKANGQIYLSGPAREVFRGEWAN